MLNGKQTTLAQQKQQLIRDAFKDWIWADPTRRQTLVEQYNREMNSIRPREYDGSHIVFAGMNPEIRLREHQRNAIAHVLYGGNTLLAHEVGAGKTFEMVGAAMEAKRLGLCRKSLFVVPNHLTEQWASEFLRLYPSANILVTKQKDFETRNRKKFCARIATGDYDAVIIGHSQFEKIPISQERQEALLEDQIEEITLGISELRSNNAERFSIKQLERAKRSLEARLEKLQANDKKDDVVTFEELGVDRLFVDEAHSYKNLFLYTKMQNVAGLSTSDAQKSSDMFAKCRYMDELTGGRGVIFATGTPVSNSMTELYTMQRYLQYDRLQEMGMIHFDCWASRFGETVTALELAPEGKGYRPRTRFSRFFNLPELMNIFREVADIKTADQLHLPVPEVEYHNVAAKPSEVQKELVQELSERAALSFAEIKALCAGDPRIKERMDLDVDVARLKIMKADYKTKQFRLEDSLIRSFPAEIAKMKEQMESLKADMQTLSEHPHPEGGFAGMTVLSDTLLERENAGAALIEAAKQATGRDPVEIGTYRGFTMSVTLENFGKKYVLTMQGKFRHPAELGSDPKGNLIRLDNALAQMPQRMQSLQTHLEETYHQQEAAKAELEKPWPYEQELRDKTEKLQSSLIYQNVFPGIDLQYTTFGYNIKEQIIINEPQPSYRFDFLLESDGLSAVLNENGSVSFLNADQEEVYQIPIPCMEDAAGLGSFDVHFALNETEQGTVLTVEAGKEWINSEDREFPVMIDPTLTVISGSALEDIYSAYTMEAAPNDTTLGRQWLYVGAQPYSTTNDGRYRTYMHIQSMPTVPNGSEVVDAQLSLYKTAYVQRNCEQLPIGAYEVTTDLPSSYSSYYDWFSKMTWRRDQPEYDTTNAIDYAFGKAGKEYVTWHLTELVKKWYIEGTDNTTIALAMTNEDEIGTYTYYASATFYAYAGSIPPILTVSYRNNTGIEPYYTYATLGAGEAGTAYISDHTGQLKIAKKLVSYASSTNPFSLSLVYNSDYFSRSSSDYCPPSKLGLSMNVGSGWTLDCIQRVEAETISNISYLKYTDGDGTIHYFCKDSSKNSSYYYDEDGLSLKIKSTGSNAYLMSDDDGNEWTFTDNYLRSIKDSDGNKININYTSGRLSGITQENKGQSAITVATFTYSGNNLTSVTDAAGNVYTLTYSGTNLVGIKRGSTNLAAYTYSGYRATKMTDSESGYSLAFTYSNGKVSKYQEATGSGTGATVSVTYPDHSETVYRDHGADRTSGNSDDVLTHFLFDYAGRTVNAYTTDNTGNILGATNAAYSGSGSTDKTNNRTVRSGSIGQARQNLLQNGGLEDGTTGWTFNNGTSRATTKPRTGAYSIKGTLSSTGSQSALISSGTLTAGKTYTISGYVNTSGITNLQGGAISLMVTDGSKSWTSQLVNYITSPAVDDGWVRISVTFTPDATDEYGIFVNNSGAIGTFYADDLQVEEGDAPSSYNLVANGNMEGTGRWTMGTNAAFSTSYGVAGSAKSLRVTGDPLSASTNAYQDIVLNLPGTQTYVLSGWARANAVPDDPSELDNPNDVTKKCGLRATITYSDGKTEGHYVAFNSDISNQWQFTNASIVPKQSTKTVQKIRVTLAYEGNANKCYFDNISLLREVAQTMKYDSDGKLVSVTSTGLDKDTNTYSGGNLIKTVTGGNGTFNYTYDTTYTHRLKSVSNGQITQSMGYDGTGNVTTTTLSGSGGKTIQTTAAYGGNGNRLTSVTDASGATVSYGYGNADSQMRGLPTSVTDPKGTVTNTTYDSSGRVTQTGIANTANLMYTYSSGNLSSIQRTNGSGASQTYGFTYDSFGNMLSAKVGNRNLSTNTYASGNGQMTKQAYGNGASVTYAYDILGRVKTATYADGRKLTYAYNGEGQLHSLRETGNGTDVTYVYTYDSIGRLIDSQQLDGSNIVIRTNQAYNSSNQMTKQSWQVGGDSYAQDLTYNSSDGSLNTFEISRNGSALTKFTMGYDGLRRLTSMSSGVFTRNYAYRDISGSQTTTQVQSVEYTKAPSGTPFTSAKYSYTYDDAGNILTVTDNIGNVTTYTYDNQGQLLTEHGNVSGMGDAPFNYSDTYTYDGVGNILTASDGETTHTYTYGDSNWKDLLTAYDGESITYDAIGNPTSYYNGNRWTFGWENGRQLTSLSKQPPVVITTQPENYYGTVGGTATFTVAASGDRVTYQWQRSINDGETWDNISGGTSTTLSVPIQAGLNGYLYRCIAKDYMGHIATSQAGKLTVTSALSTISEFDPEYTVINEPDDYYGRPGDIATFIVEAEGANLSYQWLCRAPGASNFEYLTSSDATTNTLRVEMTAASNGAEYRCFITDANGDMGSTRIATIKLDILDWEMEYNTSGIRTKRSSEEKAYNYIYAGDKLMRMTVGNDVLDFSYDTNGVPLTMTYNGTVYYYITNLQGDVIKMERADGSTGASYAYDAWGNILRMSGTLAELNPLRYRGYVYDQETGFYYLQSRYYDPAVGRFINADSYASTGRGFIGYNMFAYCANNPVNCTDPTGCFLQTLWEFVQTAVAEVGRAFGLLSPAYAGCGTAALADGPLPFGDALGAAGAILVTVGAIGYGVYRASKAYSNKQDTSSNELSIAKSYARTISDSGDKYVVHHIVAQKDYRANAARNVLTSVGINPSTSGLNLAVIPEKKHLSLHTNKYFDYVNSRFAGLEGNAAAVALTLVDLQFEIQIYCQTGWKTW